MTKLIERLQPFFDDFTNTFIKDACKIESDIKFTDVDNLFNVLENMIILKEKLNLTSEEENKVSKLYNLLIAYKEVGLFDIPIELIDKIKSNEAYISASRKYFAFIETIKNTDENYLKLQDFMNYVKELGEEDYFDKVDEFNAYLYSLKNIKLSCKTEIGIIIAKYNIEVYNKRQNSLKKK